MPSRPQWSKLTLLVIGIGGAALGAEKPTGATGEPVDFIRHIRPILSDRCFQCHGPDQAQRQAELRLDLAEEIVSDRDGAGAVIERGNPEESLLYQRIIAADDERMPPVDAGPPLTPHAQALIRRWIKEGAESTPHWSFVPPQRSPLPKVQAREWIRNGIDHFVLATLEKRGVSPSAEADPAVLMRRVSLDLTGLPPTPDQIDAYLADTSPDAYEQLVNRLLDSPRYGERMAVVWLDAARYADTNGYQLDSERSMWRWRDWVIDAYNRNLPFDQFTIEQLAGDLLANPTLDQLIATGFNRNHRINSEGGSLPEEFLVENVVDRVDTTATVWLGLTMACARCHDHKYDPITQREFYEFYAFFNNVPEKGTGPREGNSGPIMAAPTAEQRAQHEALAQEQAAIERSLAAQQDTLAVAQADWERRASIETARELTDALVLHFELDGDLKNRCPGEASGEPMGGAIPFETAILGQGAVVGKEIGIAVDSLGDFEADEAFSYGGWLRTTNDATGHVISRVGPNVNGPGYRLRIESGVVWSELLSVEGDHAIRIRLMGPLPDDRWQHLFVTYDGSRSAKGVRIYVDGVQRPTKTTIDSLEQRTIRAEGPLLLGGSDGFTGKLDDVRIYAREVSAGEVATLAGAVAAARILDLPPERRSPPQTQVLRRYYLDRHAPADYRASLQELASIRDRMEEHAGEFPALMVMREMESPRETHLLIRGAYDQPGPRVSPGVPRCLPPMDAELPRNRLGLARWLVNPQHPLTARVAVNRFWQMYFGTGLVETSENFGSQGAVPSYARLLDWLATEFVRSEWDVKALQKLIVTSATYRQRTDVTPQQLEIDPQNRLLARAPRLRLPAETLRDQALALGGLLVERRGGPSVRPYQPEGLWAELTANPNRLRSDTYVQGQGPELYRRSLYTYWKRTIPPPGLAVFDAPSRETCVVRRSQTSTPLQALTLLNDVTYVEAARGFAARMLTAGGACAIDRVRFALRAATGRHPSRHEESLLLGALERYRVHFEQDPNSAHALLSIGKSPRDESLDRIEHAAYTMLACVILNLDATITRE